MSHSSRLGSSTKCGGLYGLELLTALTVYDPPAEATLSDEELAIAALTDVDAFAELYDRFSGRIHLYLMRRLGNENDAADLTQQTFLKAFASLQTFHPNRGTFVGWLFTIARNTAHTDLSRSRRAVFWPLRPEDEAEPSHEEYISVRSAIETLEPRSQELIAMKFEVGLTVGEIAGTMGMKEEAVRKAIQRALKRIKEHLND